MKKRRQKGGKELKKVRNKGGIEGRIKEIVKEGRKERQK